MKTRSDQGLGAAAEQTCNASDRPEFTVQKVTFKNQCQTSYFGKHLVQASAG